MIHRFALACALSLVLCSFAPAARDSNAAEPPATTLPTTAPAEPRIVARLRGHGGLFVGFSPDGSRILTAGKMDLQLWDARTYEPVGSAVEYPGEFVSARFAAGGHVAYLAHSTGVWLFDAQTGARIGPGVKAPSQVWTAAVSPDGRTAALSWVAWPERLAEPVIHLFDTISGREVRRLRHGDIAIYAAFSPDGRTLLTGEGVGMTFRTFRVWDVAAARERFAPITVEANFNNPPQAMQRPGTFSPDGHRFAVVANRRFAVFDTDTGRRLGGKPPPYDDVSSVDALVFAADGKWIVCVDNSLGTTLCDAATAKPRADMAYVPNVVNSFDVAADGTRLACSYQIGDREHDARTATGIFDLLTGKLLHRLGGDHENGVPAFSPSGERVAVTGTGMSKEDTTVWSVAGMKQ